MYKIGLFSKMNKVTIKTLRYYDEIGLLKPAHVDEFTGYRYYKAEQLPRLHRIMMLRSIGFSINEIITAINGETGAEKMMEYLHGKHSEISDTVKEGQAKLNLIKSYLNILKQEEKYMSYTIIIKELPEVIVASMRTVIPDYGAFNSVYPEMGKYMETQKVKCAAPEYCFTIYHDGEHREFDIDVEICEAVTDYGQNSDKVKFKKIDAVKTAACVLHRGPYSSIGMAYGAVMNWIEENGYKLAGPPRESYIDGCWNKDNPEDWLTEIQIPVTVHK